MNVTLQPQCSSVSQLMALHVVSSTALGVFGTLGAILCVCIITGNSLVIYTIVFSECLQGLQHSFIASLAFADLLLAVFILPLTLTRDLLQGLWIFGSVLCTFWLGMDIVLCTVSILNLCLISVDRYLSIRYPLRYLNFRTRPRVALSITAVWALAGAISLPTVVGWSRGEVDTHISEHKSLSSDPVEDLNPCTTTSCELPTNLYYVIYSSCGSFFLPLVLLVVVYVNIFLEARRRLEQNMNAERLDFLIQHSLPENKDGQTTVVVQVMPPSDESNFLAAPSSTATFLNPSHGFSQPQMSQPNLKAMPDMGFNKGIDARRSFPPGGRRHVGPPSGVTTTHSATNTRRGRESVIAIVRERRRQKRKRELRTTLVVTLILGAFVACWLPFFTAYLIRDLLPQLIPGSLFTAFFWLGYCNSALNPIIYTIFNPEYRSAFRKTLLNLASKCFLINAH